MIYNPVWGINTDTMVFLSTFNCLVLKPLSTNQLSLFPYSFRFAHPAHLRNHCPKWQHISRPVNNQAGFVWVLSLLRYPAHWDRSPWLQTSNQNNLILKTGNRCFRLGFYGDFAALGKTFILLVSGMFISHAPSMSCPIAKDKGNYRVRRTPNPVIPLIHGNRETHKRGEINPTNKILF